MRDYYSELDRIKAAGLEYATNGITAGEMMPMESPFSGEWADGLTGQDVLDAAGITARFDALEDYEQTDVLDHWESGYNSAEWPFPDCAKGKHSPALTDDEETYILPPYCDICGHEGDDVLHKGHTLRLTGAWYCDTCDSPLCDLA